MGICYTIIMLDDFDWNHANTDKEKRLAEFKQEFGAYCCEKVGSWYGAVVFDIDKFYPLLPERRKVIEKYCDKWYFIADSQLTTIYDPADCN